MTPTTEELAALCESLRQPVGSKFTSATVRLAAADALEALGGEVVRLNEMVQDEARWQPIAASYRDERDSLRAELAAAKGDLQMLRGQLAGKAQGNVAKGAFEIYADNEKLRAENAALAKDRQRYLAVIAHIRGGHYRGDLIDYIDSEFAGFSAIDAAIGDSPSGT